MDKKKYQKPDVKIVLVDATSILEGSTGATGDDVPWAAKQVEVFDEVVIDEDLF